MATTRKHATRRYGELQIRSRAELAGNGEDVTFRSVHCPRRHRSVAIHECAGCSRAQGLFAGPAHDRVRCSAAPLADLEYRSIRDAAERCTVSSVMSHDVVCVREDVSLESLTSLLLDRNFSGLPVIDEDGRAVGVVSKTDLLRRQRELANGGATAEPAEQEIDPGFHAVESPATVADIMTPIAFTVPEDATISSAAAIMAAREIHRLPVLDQSGTVVGLLTTTDIVDWVAQGAPRKLMKRDREAGQA